MDLPNVTCDSELLPRTDTAHSAGSLSLRCAGPFGVWEDCSVMELNYGRVKGAIIFHNKANF